MIAGAILDYAAEDDVEPAPKPQQEVTNACTPAGNVVVARTYSYEGEQTCDQHVQVSEDVWKSCPASNKLIPLGCRCLLPGWWVVPRNCCDEGCHAVCRIPVPLRLKL